MKKTFYVEIAVVALFALFVGAGVATHILAWQLGMQAALGDPAYVWQPLTRFSFVVPFYAPWQIAVWYWQWGLSVDFMRGSLIVGGLSSGACIGAWGIGIFRRHTLDLGKEKFGKDAWGTESDLKRAGLLSSPPTGTVLGMWGRKLISFNGDQHQLIAGAAGSGKTHGPVIASLLTCRNSILAIDPKRALYANTARWRDTISDTFYFDPTDRDSVRYNPLAEIIEETEIAQAQNIAAILVDASGLGQQPSMIWPIKAADLLTGLILYCVRHLPKSQQHLGHVRHLLSNEEDTYVRMAESSHKEIRRVGSIMIPLAPKIRQSISITTQSTLDVFADDLVVDKTSTSDFRLSDLVCNDNPMSLYLQVRASEARRLRPLQRIIMTQLKRAMMYDLDFMPDGRKKKHRLTMILEEFPALGKDESFEYDLRQFREYGVTAVIFCQSILDLEAVYGRDQTIRDNCHITVCFAASNPRSLTDISIMLGKADEKKTSETRPRWFAGIFSGHQKTEHHRRPLMDEGEIRRMGLDEQLMFVTGTDNFRTKKVLWFNHGELSRRGTNLRKGGVAPGQNPRFLAKLQETIADAPAKQEIVVKEPDDLLNRLTKYVSDRGWGQREAARNLFPEFSERQGGRYITGEKAIPPIEALRIEKILAGEDD